MDEGEGPQWAVFHVGDSRVYRWTGDRLEQCTRDHSVVQELIDAGYLTDDGAAAHPQRHIITRALGVGPRPEADVVLLPVVPGDRFLACSDGLTGELGDDRLAEILGGGRPVEETATTLTTAAESVGARGWRKLRTITLPLTTPGYIAGALLVFIWTFSDFATPLVLGVHDLLASQAYLNIVQFVDRRLFRMGIVISAMMVRIKRINTRPAIASSANWRATSRPSPSRRFANSGTNAAFWSSIIRRVSSSPLAS